MKKKFYLLSILLFFFFTACTSSKNIATSEKNIDESPLQNLSQIEDSSQNQNNNEISLLFAGDIMAHNVNYNISSYDKIWRDVKNFIETPDLSFANLEAPVDTTKSASSYPNFNMTKKYVKASINAGFDVFSLCNNHTNDQGLEGIKETIKTFTELQNEYLQEGKKIYFSGTKLKTEDDFTYNIIDYYGWKILFLPITELLNRPSYSSYINFVENDEENHTKLKNYIKKLDKENPNDIFILSLHTKEPEYTRVVSDEQENFYKELLDCGVDVLWANHAHIIKDRKYIFYSKQNAQKVIMYGNGNVISGQRTSPDFNSKNPNGERDNTGDGLMIQITFTKDENGKKAYIKNAKNIFITTYINTANEYVIKPINQEFIDYLYDVPRKNWANYIERRNKINNQYTKDLIEWQ